MKISLLVLLGRAVLLLVLLGLGEVLKNINDNTNYKLFFISTQIY